MQTLLPQPPEAFEAYMDSHVQEAAQEGESGIKHWQATFSEFIDLLSSLKFVTNIPTLTFRH